MARPVGHPPTTAAAASGPRFLATTICDTLAALEAARLKNQVLGRLAPELAARVTTLRASDWISLDDHLAFYHATAAALGLARATEVWRGTMTVGLHTGSFNKFRESMQRTLSLDATKIAKRATSVWAAATRDCGQLVVAGEEGRLEVRFVNLPRALAASVPFCVSMQAKLEALFLSCGVEPRVTQTERDADKCVLAFLLTWQPSGS